MNNYRVVHLINSTYQVVLDGSVLFQGSLADCKAYVEVME